MKIMQTKRNSTAGEHTYKPVKLNLFGVIKRFLRWKHSKLTTAILMVVIIIINGTLAISGVYPLWIGYFNYLTACTPLIFFLDKRG